MWHVEGRGGRACRCCRGAYAWVSDRKSQVKTSPHSHHRGSTNNQSSGVRTDAAAVIVLSSCCCSFMTAAGLIRAAAAWPPSERPGACPFSSQQ